MGPERWRQVEAIYESALNKAEPTERSAYLDSACGADQELRREVDSLLACADKADGFLEIPAAALVEPAASSAGATLKLAGRSVSHYRILEKLGEGGMGAVYRAHDERLRRTVALKLLPAEYAADPERRRRLLREAQAASALSHPNIVAIHEVGSDSGVDFIAMELVEGKTLDALIPKKGLPLAKALDYAVQIAGGLAKAHAGRVVHRDLKPGNVMVTSDGLVKVLDFGLARLVRLEPGLETTLTVEGEIAGTPAYMSPEQAEGKPLDTRSDIFSFGALLYQMLSGRPPFPGSSTASTLAAILREDPSPLGAKIPCELEKIVMRCLRKDPAHRFQHIDDVKVELEDLQAEAAAGKLDVAPPRGIQRPRRRRRIAAALLATAAVSLLCGFAACLYLTEPLLPDQSQLRFTPFAVDPGGYHAMGGVWSPNGKAVAFYGKGQVFVRRLESGVPTPITRIQEDAKPFAWTPDGHRILFGTVRKPSGVWSVAAVEGSEPEPVLELDGTSFSPIGENYIVAASPTGEALAALHRGDDGRYGVWISSPPGAPLQKYSPDPFSTLRVREIPFLRFSPDGKKILLHIRGENGSGFWLLPFPPNKSQIPRQVFRSLPRNSLTPDFMPTFGWMPDSRYVVLSTGRLWLADTVSDKYQGISAAPRTWAFPAVSPSGKALIYADYERNFDIVSAGLDGSIHRLIATERSEQMPSWAARRQRMVYVSDRNGPMEIWLREGDVERPIVTPREFPVSGARSFINPRLSPEGDRVVYAHKVNEDARLWISGTAAGGAPIRLTNDSGVGLSETSGSWSPNGSWFTYCRAKAGTTWDLMKVKTTGQATPIRVREGHDEGPSWSPTGEWILTGEVLVSPDGNSIRPIGKHGSPCYVFSADGKLLYGLRPEGDRELLFSVNIASGAETRIAVVGAEFRPSSTFTPVRFSLSPDGKSFVYSVVNTRITQWLMEGFAPKVSLLARLGLLRK